MKLIILTIGLLLSATSFSLPKSGFYDDSFSIKIEQNNKYLYYSLDGFSPSEKLSSCFEYAKNYDEEGNITASDELCGKSYKYKDHIYIKDRSFSKPDSYAKITTTEKKVENIYPIEKNITNELISFTNQLISFSNEIIAHVVRFIRFIGHLFTGDIESGAQDVFGLPYIKYTVGKLPKATVLQVKDIKNNTTDSRVYFFSKSLKSNLPIINITISPDELYSQKKGIFSYGEKKPNWNDKRKINAFVTIISKERQHVFESSMLIRIHGGGSRKYPIKSLRLYPNKEGINFDVFDNGYLLGYQRINLRNSGQDHKNTYLADASIHRVFSSLNFGVQRYKPYLIFINGQYYGILNARDRRDHHYIKNIFNLPNKNIDHIKRNKIVKKGDKQYWEETLKKLMAENPTDNEFYISFDERFDLNSFYDYFSAQVYIADVDWPQNNIAYWRSKNINREHKYMDGKWRWLLYDTDLHADWMKGGASSNHESLQRLMNYKVKNNQLDEKTLFSYAIQNKQIREEFIIRFVDLLNSHFLYENFETTINAFANEISSEMERHIQRWERPRSMAAWRSEINNMLSFFKARKRYQLQHLQEVFELEDSYLLRINVNNPAAGTIQVNSISLGALAQNGSAAGFSLPWKGEYFKGMPLTLTALPMTGHKFSHWEVVGNFVGDKRSKKLLLEPTSDLSVKAIFIKADN